MQAKRVMPMYRINRKDLDYVLSLQAEAVKAVEERQRNLRDVTVHHLLPQVHPEAAVLRERLKVGLASHLLECKHGV